MSSIWPAEGGWPYPDSDLDLVDLDAESDDDVERPRRTAERSGRVADLLRAAKPVPGADHATFHSGDGLYRASIPLEELGRAELEDGRLTVPGGQTKCWNVKDVVRIEVTI